MADFFKKTRHFFFPFLGEDHTDGGYGRFRLMLYGAMFLISFTPLILATGLSSREHKKLLQIQEQEQLVSSIEGAQNTIEAFIHELQSMVRFVAGEYSYEELLEQGRISELFAHLKGQYPGFVDMGVIGPDGIQKKYAGPFRLEGYDYSEQDWYVKVLTRQLYISDVFMGFRKLPHFVIAVSNKLPGKEEYWVLRLSVDYETLANYVSTVNTRPSQDIFLVNNQGRLQTKSIIFGDILDMCPFFTHYKKGETVIHYSDYKGKKYLRSYVQIKNSPWMVVIVIEGYMYGEKWSSHRLRVRMIFLGCTVLILLVVVPLVNTITNRLQEADQNRNQAVIESQYTNKFASIGRLAAGVAHEINNPLAIIDQKAGLVTDLMEISEEFEHKDKLLHSVDGILTAVQRCKVITHRLLGFARRMDVAFEHIDVSDLINEVLGFLEGEALYSRIRFEKYFAENLPMVFSDRGQLQQIFLNIINNAIDAVGKDGLIVFSAELDNRTMVNIKIKDSGPGMSHETVKRIFDPFFTTKEAGKGTGLGLSITYGLVNKLGGKISVESKIGQGTTFSVCLPINDARNEGNYSG